MRWLICLPFTACAPVPDVNLARATLEQAHAQRIKCDPPERVQDITDQTALPVTQYCTGYVTPEFIKTLIDLSKRDGSVVRIDRTDNVNFTDESKRPLDFAAFDYCKYSAELEICIIMYTSSSETENYFVSAAQRK